MLVNYDPSFYPTERDNTNWTKILPRQDNKTQSTEFSEVQTLINKQIQKGFSFLYNYYSITKGLRVFVVNYNDASYDIILEGGQFYIESIYGGFFVDVDSTNITIPNNQRTFIGVQISFLDDRDNIQNRNPHTGGRTFGSQGANRLLIETEIVLNENNNSLPIAVITPSTFGHPSGKCEGVNYFIWLRVFYTLVGDTTIYEYLTDSLSSPSSITGTGPLIRGWSNEDDDEFGFVYSNDELIQNEGTLPFAFDKIIGCEIAQTQRVDSSPDICFSENVFFPPPVIKHFKNQVFSRDRTNGVIPDLILKMLQQRIHESAGDFIDRGLQVSYLKETTGFTFNNVNDKTIALKVSPGVAYIKGRRVELQYPSIIEVPAFSIQSQSLLPATSYNRILIYLTELGDIGYLLEEDNQIYTIDLPPNSIDLAQVDIFNQAVNGLELKHNIINSKKVMPTVSDIINIQLQHEENERRLADVTLDLEALNLIGPLSNQLSGIFTDSFTSLSKSNIFNPIYSASIIPSIQAVRPKFTIFNKDFSNVTVNPTLGTRLLFNEFNESTYASVAYQEELLVEIEPASNFLVLNPLNPREVVAEATPNIIYRDTQSSNSNLIAYADPRTSGSNQIDAPILIPSLDLNAVLNEDQVITLRVTQLPSQMDNLQILFGNQILVNFQILKGSPGSSTGTVRATDSGEVTITFNLPTNLTENRYAITITNNRLIGSAEIKIVDPLKERAIRDVSITSLISNPPSPSAIIGGVCQTFLIENPVTITSCSFKLRSIGQLSTINSILYVSLVKIVGGIPTTESLGYGILNNEDIRLSVNGNNWSRVEFNIPIQISQSGEYGLIVTSAFSTIELYHSTVGELQFSNVIPSEDNFEVQSSSPLKDALNGTLFISNPVTGEWEPDFVRDLCIQLYQAVPESITGELEIEVSNTEPFNEVEVFIPIFCPAGNFTQLFVKDGEIYKLANEGHIQLSSSTTSTTIKLQFGGNPSLFCIVNLSNLQINLFQNNSSGSWISVSTEFDNPYENVQMSFEYYIGEGDSITPYFSSDDGITWETLDLDSVEVIDGGPPILKANYEKLNLNPIVVINNQNTLRTKLRLRLDFTASNVNIMPYARRVSSLAY